MTNRRPQRKALDWGTTPCGTSSGDVLRATASGAKITPEDTVEEINTSIRISTVVSKPAQSSLPLHRRQSDSQGEPGDARLSWMVHMPHLVARSHRDPPRLR